MAEFAVTLVGIVTHGIKFTDIRLSKKSDVFELLLMFNRFILKSPNKIICLFSKLVFSATSVRNCDSSLVELLLGDLYTVPMIIGNSDVTISMNKQSNIFCFSRGTDKSSRT